MSVYKEVNYIMAGWICISFRQSGCFTCQMASAVFSSYKNILLHPGISQLNQAGLIGAASLGDGVIILVVGRPIR